MLCSVSEVFRTFETAYRSTLDIGAIPVLKKPICRFLQILPMLLVGRFGPSFGEGSDRSWC